ncbi:MAG: serine/threonine-protein kinase [Isosphaeraceae bacterium]
MTPRVRCSNPNCRRPTRLGVDALGRSFRCGSCGTKLAVNPMGEVPFAAPAIGARAPWESEPPVRGRSLGSATPARLGRYQVLGLLGHGERATTYLGIDPNSERRVALKVPRRDGQARDDSKARARFLAEGRTLARLRHPAIGAFLEAVDDDRLLVATALVPGKPLVEVLDEGRVVPERAAEIALAIADALSHAHVLGMSHKALRPSNVMVLADSEVVLLDFALSWIVGPSLAEFWRSWPAYLAPELARGATTADPALCDQYSLGVILYQMLCGRPPFIGTNEVVLFAAWNDDPLPPRAFRAGIPQGLERVCLRAMARRPEDRYPNCGALATDLRRWLARSRRTQARLGRVRGAGRWVRRRPAETVSAALAVLALAATSFYASSRLAPSSESAARTPPPALASKDPARR